MTNRSLVSDGHGLKSAMRVLAHSALFLRGLEPARARVVQHQKGTHLNSVGREEVPYRKAIAYPVVRSRAVCSQYLLLCRHLLLLLAPGLEPSACLAIADESLLSTSLASATRPSRRNSGNNVLRSSGGKFSSTSS